MRAISWWSPIHSHQQNIRREKPVYLLSGIDLHPDSTTQVWTTSCIKGVAFARNMNNKTGQVYLPSFELLEQGLEEGHGLLELDGGCVARGGVLYFLWPSLKICFPFCRPPLQVPRRTNRQLSPLHAKVLHVDPSAGWPV